MKVRVDEARCQGHTLCHATAPRIFQLREEDGHSVVLQPRVPRELEALAERAALGCPEQAIIIEPD